MSIKVSTLANLRSLKNFNLIAGESGYDNEIRSVCLADLEVDNNLVPYANGFRRGSFVIASMRSSDVMRQVKFLDLIKSLMDYKCVGLAYNIKMQKRPSKAIIDYCNENKFPLYVFDPGEIFMENVVYEIMHAINKSSMSSTMNKEIRQMLEGEMTKREVENMAKNINPMFRKKCVVSYIWPKEPDNPFNLEKTVRNYVDKNPRADIITSLLTYRNGILVISTMDKFDKKKKSAVLKNVTKGIDPEIEICISSSSVRMTFSELDVAIRESEQAYVVCNIEEKDYVEYDDIGLYKLLLPNRSSEENIQFMNKYLSGMNEEQIETAAAFVQYNGDMDKITEKLICHINTVRYRINKIHEKVEPNVSDYQFMENLSTAMKIYLSNNIKR